jgi:glycosyltransferase involved in cell wall biosynthesis
MGDIDLSFATRILLISYTFPPHAAVGGLRIANLCRYLPEHGIEPIVVSVKDEFYPSLDYSVRLPTQVRMVRTKLISTPLDLYRRGNKFLVQPMRNGALSERTGPDVGFFRRQGRALLQMPDPDWGWYFPAVRAAKKLIREENIDVIFSSGPPWISHLVALRLKKKYGLPWAADFRDPWARFLTEKKGPGWQQHLTEELEDCCIYSADLVICNTDRLCQSFQRHYFKLNSSKFRTLTNGYEDSNIQMPSVPKPSTEKRIFLHLGSIYGLRRTDTFLHAIAELARSGKLDPNSFQLIFQGNLSPDFVVASEQSVSELVDNHCLEFRPRTSWEEAQSTLAKADLLLLFQGHQELQVPAKFYEYLQTGIPIFAVSEVGALTDLLSSTQSGLWASPRNSEEIAYRFLQALKLPRRTPDQVRRLLSGRYRYRELSAKFARWIEELARHRTPRALS